MTIEQTGARLDATVPIAVLEPLRAVNQSLLELLRGFSSDDWQKPTVHPTRDVKDLTAHLLHGSLRRVSAIRDAYQPPPSRPIAGFDDLVAFIQDDNRAFMTGMRRVSPAILIEWMTTYDPMLEALLAALDPTAPGLGVAWAGEASSLNWFDIAREYTEKWHHQQQLRDATGRPPLYQPELLTPVLETFARGLPYAYRDHPAADATAIAVSITGPVQLGWTLRKAAGRWSLWRGCDPAAHASVALSADVAWRLWTKGLDPDATRSRLQLDGEHVAPLTRFVAIMA